MVIFHIFCICVHFICDWIIQPRDIAKTKHVNPKSLRIHLFTNILPCLIIIFGLGDYLGYEFHDFFFMINLGSHAAIDWYLPKGNTEREMVNWVAIDQILHLSILFLTL